MGVEARVLREKNAQELADWCGGNLVLEHDALDHEKTQPGINVPCGSEMKRASLGDIIIRDHEGAFRIQKLGAGDAWRGVPL